MRAFQTVFVALSAVAASNAQFVSRSYGTYGTGLRGLSYGTGYGSYGTGYGLGYGGLGLGGVSYGSSYVPSVSYGYGSGYSAAPAISYGSYGGYGGGYGSRISTSYAAPAYSGSIGVVSAPAVSTIAAAPVSTIAAAPIAARSVGISTVAAAPAVNVGVIAAGGAPALRSHEIHTGSGAQAIRIEDFQAGDQVIRVHEGPQAGPEIAQVQVPGEQHHIRVINHQSGPAQVERVVGRAETQVVDVQKPGRPGARIVQVVKGQSAAPAIEFVDAGQGSSHHVYYADDVNAGGAIGGGIAYGAGYGAGYGRVSTSYAAPAYSGSVGVVAAPAVSTIATRTVGVSAAPAISVAAAPAVSYSSSYAPISSGIGGYSYGNRISYGGLGGYGGLGYTTGGLGYSTGGLGYSTGYSSYGNGNTVYLDAKKKASAKKSA